MFAKAPVLNDFADKQPVQLWFYGKCKRRPTKRLASSICLYMPATVGVNQLSRLFRTRYWWSCKNVAAFSDEFAKSGSFADSFGAIKGDIATTQRKICQNFIRHNLPGLSGIFAEITHGRVFSNRMEMVFKGVPRRTFSFQFTMMPKSENVKKYQRNLSDV